MNSDQLSNLIKTKKEAKGEVAKALSFAGKKPLLAVIIDHELSEKQETFVQNLLLACKEIDTETVILADSNLHLGEGNFAHVMPYDRKNRKKILDASDMALCFPWSDVEEMLLSGTVPISVKRNELEDYNPNHETGNSFVFGDENVWSAFAALVRARETFKLPYDWKGIVRSGIEKMNNGK